MDQLKEFLQQAAKHRFWIAIGVASILSLCAYFVGTGAIAQEEKKARDEIKAAVEGVKPFASGQQKNGAWTDVVKEKASLVEKDVNASWAKLYERQAPLLDWPGPVKKWFEEDPLWDRQYPKDVDPQQVRDVILEYTQAYPDYVERIYRSFQPFDTEEGTGIVAAPPKSALLRPQVYQEDKLPTLGEVWSAQQKLWIQRTILKVIADVNARAKAKDWDSAVVKQILSMEVANALALDQKTEAKGEAVLEDAPEILAPGQASSTEKSSTSTAAAATSGSAKFADMGGAMGGAGEGAATAPEKIQFVKSGNPEQFYIVPVALKVYIEQDRIPDLLVEFKNSPMSIRVLDFEMKKPVMPVKKPRKGQNAAAFGASMGSGMGRGAGMLGGEMMMAGGMGAQGMDSESYRGGAGGSAYNRGMRGGGGAMGGGPGGVNQPKARESGKNVKAENAKALLEAARDKNKKGTDKDKKKEEEAEEESTASDPYFNVVEVEIRGQARFYKAPPKPATPEPTSPGAPTEAAKADAAKAEPAKGDAAKTDASAPAAPKEGEAKKDDAKAAPTGDQPKDDAAKAEPSKDAPKDAEPKKDDAKAEPAKDAPKADETQGEPAKGEAPKADAPKSDAPKAEPPKGEAPKDAGNQPKPAGEPKP